MTLHLVFMTVMLFGCRGTPEAQPATQPATPVHPATGSAGSASPTSPAKWACAADGDCMNSCSEGAVSQKWYASASVDECDDGCANQIHDPPRCIDGGCVAFIHDPHDEQRVQRDPGCTHRP
jgi:hypothetical protein